MEPGSTSTSSSADDRPALASRVPELAPIAQLTRGLISTYNRINQNYYNKRKLAQDGQALHRKKKSASGSKKTDADYELLAGEEVFHGRYKVNGKRLGMGSFGQVVEAQDMQTGQEVAIKIVKKKKNFTTQAQLEINILESLHSTEHPGRKYIVQLRETFVHKGHQCIVFERLDSTLYDVLKRTLFKGVSLKLVRKITRQILVALDYLAHPSVNVIHCDLKPENILLVHSSRSKLKLIDFGSSCLSQSQLYQYIQSRFYRSPEVLLGTPYTTAIDMWSLACIMVEMHTGKPLFGGANQHDQLRRMVNVLGMPPNDVIEQANPTYRRDYFDEHVVGEGQVEYSLKVRKIRESLLAATGQLVDGPTTLAEIVGANSGGPGGVRRSREDHSPEDYRLFLDLLHRMLDYNPATRITPAQALLHPFVASGRLPMDMTEKKKSKTMRTTQMRDAHDRSSSFFDPAESQRVKLRRLHENPGSAGH